MKFYIDKHTALSYYTCKTLECIIKHNNHIQVRNPKNCDIILYSVMDVVQIPEIIKLKEKYKGKYIFLGGVLSPYYKFLLQWCDAVNVGQGFECFKAKSINELEDLDCIAINGKQNISSSNKIEWNLYPQISLTFGDKTYIEIVHSIGCPNKCKFCFISATNKYQINPIFNKLIDTSNLYLIGNNFPTELNLDTCITTLKNYLKHKGKYKSVKVGIEFATETNRRKYTPEKWISNDEIYKAVEKALSENTKLTLFCIAGIDEIEDWKKLITGFPLSKKSKLVSMAFSNFKSQPLTAMSEIKGYEKKWIFDFDEIKSEKNGHQYINYFCFLPFDKINKTKNSAIIREWTEKIDDWYNDIRGSGL